MKNLIYKLLIAKKFKLLQKGTALKARKPYDARRWRAGELLEAKAYRVGNFAWKYFT